MCTQCHIPIRDVKSAMKLWIRYSLVLLTNLWMDSCRHTFCRSRSLYDIYAGVLTAVAFDGGSVFLGGTAAVLKLDADTFVQAWRAAFATVDLAIAINGKVLTGTGTTLRQLTAAGANDWSKNVGGTVTSVAYDDSDNAWVAHARASSITHRKYGPTGTAILAGDHGGGLNAVRCDDDAQAIVGGVRV